MDYIIEEKEHVLIQTEVDRTNEKWARVLRNRFDDVILIWSRGRSLDDCQNCANQKPNMTENRTAVVISFAAGMAVASIIRFLLEQNTRKDGDRTNGT